VGVGVCWGVNRWDSEIPSISTPRKTKLQRPDDGSKIHARLSRIRTCGACGHVPRPRARKKNNLGFCGIFQRFVGFYFSCLVYVALHITVKDFKLVLECVFCVCVCVVAYISLGVGLPIFCFCAKRIQKSKSTSKFSIQLDIRGFRKCAPNLSP